MTCSSSLVYKADWEITQERLLAFLGIKLVVAVVACYMSIQRIHNVGRAGDRGDQTRTNIDESCFKSMIVKWVVGYVFFFLRFVGVFDWSMKICRWRTAGSQVPVTLKFGWPKFHAWMNSRHFSQGESLRHEWMARLFLGTVLGQLCKPLFIADSKEASVVR